MKPDPPDAQHFHVLVKPTEVSFTAVEGETLMGAAIRAGIRWPSVCGGHAQCGVCQIVLIQAGKAATPPSRQEAEMLGRTPSTIRFDGILRLACQLPVTSDIVVFKLGVRAPKATPEPG